MKTTLAAIVLIGLLNSGCSMFRYSADDEPVTRVSRDPTPVPPSSGGGSMSTPSGFFREVFVEFPRRVADIFGGSTPKDAVLLMEDPAYSDSRRQGINALAARSFGRQGVYTTRYAQIAQFDRDPMVRATAIRALNRARDMNGVPVFIQGLADESRQIRLESAKALANLPSNDAIPALLKVFTTATEDTDVRIAAADALRHYRTKEVTSALVASLNERDFSVAWQARQSLRALTGADYRYSQAAWNDYLKQNPLS
jgi:HEAT repeat protein